MFLVYRFVSKLMRIIESAFLLKVFFKFVSRVYFYLEEKEFITKVILFLSLDIFCFKIICYCLPHYIHIYIEPWNVLPAEIQRASSVDDLKMKYDDFHARLGE